MLTNQYLSNISLNKHYPLFIMLFLLIGSLLCLVLLTEKVKVYDEIVGVVEDDNVVCVVPIKVLNDLLEHNQIIINQKSYPYQVIEIASEISTIDDNIYKQVILDISIDQTMKQEHNTFSMIMPVEEVDLWEVIKTIIKEE